MSVAIADAYRTVVVTTGTESGGVPGTNIAQSVGANLTLNAGFGISLIADPVTNKVTIVNTGNGTGALTTITNSNSNGTFYPIFTRAPGSGDVNPLTSTYQMDSMYLDQTTTPMSYNPSTSTLTASTFAGNLTGNVTGNVTGNLSGDVTGNLTGTVTGSITGNAQTVSNGVYTTSSYADPAWITSLAYSKISGVPSVNANTLTGNTLASNVLYSSLTSVGSLSDLRLSTPQVHIGNGAGLTSQGTNGVAVGFNSGRNSQGNNAVAISNNAAFQSQGDRSIAIGMQSGYSSQSQDSIAIGVSAAYTSQGQQSVAIGYMTATTAQGPAAIAIGANAGNNSQGTQSVAIGLDAGNVSQGGGAVAIGSEAGGTSQGTSSVAIGQNAAHTSQGISAIAIGLNAAVVGQGDNSVAIGNGAGVGANVQSLGMIQDAIFYELGIANDGFSDGIWSVGMAITGNGLPPGVYISAGSSPVWMLNVTTGIIDYVNTWYYGANSQASGAIAIGTNAGTKGQRGYSVAIGDNAGIGQAENAVALGVSAAGDRQAYAAVAIGWSAGYFLQQANSVAIGVSAGASIQQSYAVAIGYSAGASNQAGSSVAIGNNAGTTSQSAESVAIGANAGGNLQGEWATAVGSGAGHTGQGQSATAVGTGAGYTSQGDSAVAIGETAGNYGQGIRSVAIGSGAGTTSQNANAVAIGRDAGKTSQGVSGIAIGYAAGWASQHQYAVAIGNSSGMNNQGDFAVAIGEGAGMNNQHANSIILNANGGGLDSDGVSRFYVDPIRSATGSNVLVYNTTSKEITYTTLSASTVGLGNVTNESKATMFTSPTFTGTATLPTGSNSAAPIKFVSGTNLSSAQAGAVEYDGAAAYFTPDTIMGRSYIVSENIYRLTGTYAPTTPGDLLASTGTGFNLSPGGIYEVEFKVWFSVSVNSNIQMALVNTQAPVNMTLWTQFNQSATGGTLNTSVATGITSTSVNVFPTGGVTPASASNPFYVEGKAVIEANASFSSNIRLRMTVNGSSATITVARGSYMIVRRLPAGNVGTFAT